ncbi:MAG TPA: potassium-transporting ATPase subunit KdpA [Hyphomicrobiaceae bacterium]|nr:potassium-transporting ATPase subunit KdpA [Hyphomicrobiaceae bacterium]
MTLNGWFQIAFMLALVIATARPLGRYTATVLQGGPTFLDAALSPLEHQLYALAGIDARSEQSWRAYTVAMLIFSATGFVLLYVLLRLQHLLPLNPQGFGPMSPHLAFNTAASFVSNTNWQSYGGESTLSYLSQMAGLTVQNFLSAATGFAIAAALARAFARSGSDTVGNFWVDLTRTTLYLLLPLSLVVALALVAFGMPQNLGAYVDATTVEGAKQTLAQGPVASQVAIKQLGTNGGGFFNVNGAHPYENPNHWTNLIETWAIFSLALGLAVAFGRMIGREREGWALLSVMVLFLAVGCGLAYWAEAAGNPLMHAMGVTGTNMEGKEVRFGTALSTVWAVFTTGASNGSVNSMHNSYMPLGGLVPLALIQIGEVVPGGVGSGLYGIVVFAILAMFVAGLMVGRTPEYLGKKLEAREVKMAMLAILIMPLFILGLSAVSAVLPTALASLANPGARGYTEILYAFSSAAGNNGSAFAGLTANTPWYNTTLGITMLACRFGIIVPVMAIAGALAAKPKLAPSAGTFPTDGALFVALLSGVIVILSGLEFFPALALGPIVEHFQMLAGKTF